jgi:Putative Se/S carrier protein-like
MAAAKNKKSVFEGGGLVLFETVQDAMQAEKVLKGAGYQARLVAPPPVMRKGCDLALEVNLVEKPGIDRLLTERHVLFIEVKPLKAGADKISEIVHVTDFGDWFMVKAANMKLTFDKQTGVIVNTSGGGCPDIPGMHAALLEKKLDEAPRPRNIGYTLCALMLDRALEESTAIFKGGDRPC